MYIIIIWSCFASAYDDDDVTPNRRQSDLAVHAIIWYTCIGTSGFDESHQPGLI